MPYYGYGYYNYTDFLANNLYFLLLIPVLLLSIWAQFQVSGSFRRYSRIATRRRFTGAMAAEAVLRFNGVYDVPIRPCRGNLTDHYDPRDNTIYLSEGVYDAPTIAAVGVAAHEAGHAVQYATHYAPNTAVTREQLVTILARYAAFKGADVSAEADPDFPDVGQVSHYAMSAMAWAVERGLICGIDGKLSPKGTASRAQFATVIMRFCEKILGEPGF